MPTILNTIVIPADTDLPLHIEQVESSDLEHMQQLVGGYFEVVNMYNPTCSIYVNEEGKQQDLPGNVRATGILYVHNGAFQGQDTIVGDAFILGPPDQEGNDTSAPEELCKLLFETERFAVEVQVTEGGPWTRVASEHASWYRAYAVAVEIQHDWSLVEAVRVIPA